MDFLLLSVLEGVVFGGFVLLERVLPLNRSITMTRRYYLDLSLMVVVASLLLAVFKMAATAFESPSIVHVPSSLAGIAVFYLWFSFGNYWWHRCKHAYFWPIHRLHHAPGRLTTSMALFRSPVEMVLNLVFLFLMGRVLVDAPFYVCFAALCIEGAGEAYHHSNIKAKKSWHWYLIQSPVMHITHHKHNHHTDNFGTVSLWDTVFRTINVDSSPIYGNTKVGITRYSDYTNKGEYSVRPVSRTSAKSPVLSQNRARPARNNRHNDPDQGDQEKSKGKGA